MLLWLSIRSCKSFICCLGRWPMVSAPAIQKLWLHVLNSMVAIKCLWNLNKFDGSLNILPGPKADARLLTLRALSWYFPDVWREKSAPDVSSGASHSLDESCRLVEYHHSWASSHVVTIQVRHEQVIPSASFDYRINRMYMVNYSEINC